MAADATASASPSPESLQDRIDELQMEMEASEEAWESVVQKLHDDMTTYKQKVENDKHNERETKLEYVFGFFDAASDGTFDKEVSPSRPPRDTGCAVLLHAIPRPIQRDGRILTAAASWDSAAVVTSTASLLRRSSCPVFQPSLGCLTAGIFRPG